MAKDDYAVCVYKILKYLYEKLKRGEPVEEAFLAADSPFLGISASYWAYIIQSLLKEELIEGPALKAVWGIDVIILNLEKARITPRGIEYLSENSTMRKAAGFLKGTVSAAELIFSIGTA